MSGLRDPAAPCAQPRISTLRSGLLTDLQCILVIMATDLQEVTSKMAAAKVTDADGKACDASAKAVAVRILALRRASLRQLSRCGDC